MTSYYFILRSFSKKFLHIRYVKIKIKFLRRRLHRIIVSFSNHFPKKLLYIRCIEIKMKISGRRWQYRLLFFQRFLSIVERKILYRTTIANTALNTNRKTRDLWFWILDIQLRRQRGGDNLAENWRKLAQEGSLGKREGWFFSRGWKSMEASMAMVLRGQMRNYPTTRVIYDEDRLITLPFNSARWFDRL